MPPLVAHAGSIYTRRGLNQTMIDPISLEVVGPADTMWRLPCEHAFLPDGLRRWFGDAVWATCPCCRRQFCRGDAQLLSPAQVDADPKVLRAEEPKALKANEMRAEELKELRANEMRAEETKDLRANEMGAEEPKELDKEGEALRRWQRESEDFVSAFMRVARGLLPPCVLLAGCAERMLVLSRGHVFVVEGYDRQTEQVQVWGRVRQAELWGARLHWRRLLLYLHNSSEAKRPGLQDWLKMEYLWSQHRFAYRWEWLLSGSFMEAERLVPVALFR